LATSQRQNQKTIRVRAGMSQTSTMLGVADELESLETDTEKIEKGD
jgi:hypothetical protein